MRPRPIVAWIGAASAAMIGLFAGCSGTGANSDVLSTEALAASGSVALAAPVSARAAAAGAASHPAGSLASAAPLTPLAAAASSNRPAASQTTWVRDRTAAVEEIWNLSPATRAWLEAYDLRHMAGKPAWFGSNGYDSWAGVGQAVPRIVIHEVSHSYWGAFQVPGRPDLIGERDADGVPDTSKAFRADLEVFLAQPPDRFEPLRDRFRHMPDLASGDYPELHHAGEADLVYMTGGNISLVPPILRKYVSGYFGDRGVGGESFTDWAGAIRWWHGLSKDDRAVAGQVFGIQHFPLDRYSSLSGGSASTLSPRIGQALAREEEQRLNDFADQYGSLSAVRGSFVDATGVDRGYGFWRKYLIEMRDLHGRHPEVLRSHPTAAGPELAAAFDFYVDIKVLASSAQARRYEEAFERPYVSDFAFMLKPKAISLLLAGPGFAVSSASDSGDALGAPARAARSHAKRQLALASDVAAEEVPAGEVRAPEPHRVLKSAGVVENADVASLTAGVQRLTSHSSGNFMIDQPVDQAIYDILDKLAQSDPRGVMQVFENSRLRLQPWIEAHPDRAAAAMRTDIGAAATLVEKAADMRSGDASLVHALIAAGPEVAADVLLELDRRAAKSGDRDGLTIVPRTLNSIAYDRYWSSLGAGPKADLAADAAFFSRLARVKGAAWVETNALAGIAMYRRAMASGDVEPEFGSQHADTLTSLASYLPPSDPASSLLARLAEAATGR